MNFDKSEAKAELVLTKNLMERISRKVKEVELRV